MSPDLNPNAPAFVPPIRNTPNNKRNNNNNNKNLANYNATINVPEIPPYEKFNYHPENNTNKMPNIPLYGNTNEYVNNVATAPIGGRRTRKNRKVSKKSKKVNKSKKSKKAGRR